MIYVTQQCLSCRMDILNRTTPVFQPYTKFFTWLNKACFGRYFLWHYFEIFTLLLLNLFDLKVHIGSAFYNSFDFPKVLYISTFKKLFLGQYAWYQCCHSGWEHYCLLTVWNAWIWLLNIMFGLFETHSYIFIRTLANGWPYVQAMFSWKNEILFLPFTYIRKNKPCFGLNNFWTVSSSINCFSKFFPALYTPLARYELQFYASLVYLQLQTSHLTF